MGVAMGGTTPFGGQIYKSMGALRRSSPGPGVGPLMGGPDVACYLKKYQCRMSLLLRNPHVPI